MQENFLYDELPYSNLIFTQTHPDRLCALARLFGLNAPNVETARVLELGCGNGLNLISQAYFLPNASFLGVDLAKTHIEHAKDSVRELNLSNVEFRQCDLMELTVEEFGKFDYIIAHGLISWIPEAVREKTFSIYEEMLSENGLGYISYNTYPGWHFRQMVRGIARVHTKDIHQPSEKIEKASTFIKFLAENTQRDDFYKSIIETEMHYYENPTIAFHDNLAEINEPYYFYEFAEKLNEHGLQFLAESQLFSMSTFNYPPELKDFIDKIDGVVEKGQYMDFFSGKTFRQTLLCRNNIELNHQPQPEALKTLFLSAPLTPVSENADLTNDDEVNFAGFQKEGIEINHPLTKIALYLLGKDWGNAVFFIELLLRSEKYLEEQGKKLENRAEEFKSAAQLILYILSNLELLKIHSHRVDIYTTLDAKPKLNPLARWQLKKGDLLSAPYQRTMQVDDPILRKLAELLDGTNTHEDLYNNLVEFIKADGNIKNKNEMLKSLQTDLDEHLTHFAGSGVFVQNE